MPPTKATADLIKNFTNRETVKDENFIFAVLSFFGEYKPEYLKLG